MKLVKQSEAFAAFTQLQRGRGTLTAPELAIAAAKLGTAPEALRVHLDNWDREGRPSAHNDAPLVASSPFTAVRKASDAVALRSTRAVPGAKAKVLTKRLNHIMGLAMTAGRKSLGVACLGVALTAMSFSDRNAAPVQTEPLKRAEQIVEMRAPLLDFVAHGPHAQHARDLRSSTQHFAQAAVDKMHAGDMKGGASSLADAEGLIKVLADEKRAVANSDELPESLIVLWFAAAMSLPFVFALGRANLANQRSR